MRTRRMLCGLAVGVATVTLSLQACDEQGPVTPSGEASTEEALVGGVATFTVGRGDNSLSDKDNITCVTVSPADLARVIKISDDLTRVRCLKAGSGTVSITWNDSTPNPGSVPMMEGRVYQEALACHDQGGGS